MNKLPICLLLGTMSLGSLSLFAQTTPVGLPYTQNFEQAGCLNTLTIINANNDFKQWELRDGHAWLQYNGQEAADDWLILPAMEMTSAKGYIVKYDAWAHLGNSYPERIEVKFGPSPTVAGMTHTVMLPTDLTNKENERNHFEYTITPPSDGVYYIGFHGISDADMSGLFLDDIEVSERSLQVPGEPTDLVVTTDPNGTNRTEISVKAPTTDLSGGTLTSLTRMEILREGTVIHSVDNPAPGQLIEYTDKTATRGLTRYAAVAYTADGRGAEAFTTIFVGVNTPKPVPWVKVIESSSKPGQVTVSWGVPTEDIEGNPLNPDLITYEVVERNGIYSQTVIESNLTTTSYTYQSVPAGSEQKFVQWGVYSYTDNGTLYDTRTDMKAIGTPYSAPYRESFADGIPSSIVDNKYDGVQTDWAFFTDEDRIGAKSQDGDNGFSGFFSQSGSGYGVLTLGKVSLAGVENPGLNFYIYNPTGGAGVILDQVEIDVYADNEWHVLREFALEELPKENSWNRLSCSLADYAGKTIQVRFMTVMVNGGLVLIDNLSIEPLYRRNGGIGAITVPDIAKPNTDFTVCVTIDNLGSEAFDNYEVALLRNGAEIDRKSGSMIPVEGSCDVVFTDRLGVADDTTIFYEAQLIAPNDENSSDDAGRRVYLEVIRPNLPAPTGLTTSVDESNVTLTWSAPDMSASTASQTTESFERATSWAVDNVEGWTFIDGDNYETYGLGTYNYPNRGGKMAFQVFDNESGDFASESGFDAKSGHKFLACYASKALKNDDWAISPLLTGEEQTISLSASSMNMAGTGYQYLETFEVLYSTTGTAREDFTLISEVKDVPEKWTDYTFRLPAGALYFAIRCTSEDKYVFMVDDITFTPAASFDPDSFAGYNVYRDGKRLNSTPIADCFFTDTQVPKGDYTYAVSALFGTEESGISNLATALVVYDGVNEIAADSCVRVNGGRIYLSTAGSIYRLDGTLIATLGGEESVAVAPGIYLVKCGSRVVKVLVE